MAITGFDRKQKITIQNGQVSGTGSHSNFPVLITLDHLDAEIVDAGSNSALNGGGDIRFSSDADGNTQLACEVVEFVTNATAGSRKCTIWVKVPSVSTSTDTEIWIWYKKAGETQPAVTDTYGRNAVWSDEEFRSHDGVTDSTGNYTGAFTINGNPTQIEGPFGTTNGAYDFDGSGDYITVALGGRNPFDGVVVGDPISFGAFFYNDSNDTGNRGFQVRGTTTTSTTASLQLGQNDNTSGDVGKYWAYSRSTGASSNGVRVQMPFSTTGPWESVVAVDPSLDTTVFGDIVVYVDADALNNNTSSASWYQGGTANIIRIGARADGNQPFFGRIAETWFRKDEVSNDWRITAANNQLNPATFATAGTPESAGGGAIELVIAEASHGQAADNAALTQAHSITIAEASHGHVSDNLTLTQVHSLTVAESSHNHTADNVGVTVSTALEVAEGNHSHSAGSFGLSQVHALTVAEAAHNQEADNLALTQAHTVAIDEAASSHVADNITIGTDGTLIIAESALGHTVDSVGLAQVHNIAVDEANHTQTADGLDLSVFVNLSVADATHNHVSENLSIETPFYIDGSSHNHDSEEVTLTQLHNLAGLVANHGLTSDNLDIRFAAGIWRDVTKNNKTWTDQAKSTGTWTDQDKNTGNWIGQ